MRRGFTLIEMLVATLLLGVLVSMLMTLFTQSSIAWSAGTASVIDLGDARKGMTKYQEEADAILDADGHVVMPVIKGMKGNSLADRAVSRENSATYVKNLFTDPDKWTGISIGGASSAAAAVGLGDGKTYVVGVTSWGPDGKANTWDDITTWPAEE